MNKFTFHAVKPSDFEDVRKLCDERYGTGYFTHEVFDHYARFPELFVIARLEGVFAGFAVMVPAGEEDIAEQMKMPIEDVRQYADKKPALIYKSLALQKCYEKQGLPLAMSGLLITEAKKRGYGTLFASAWVFDGKMPIEKMFRALEFVPLYIRHNLWYDEVSYRCVVCNGRCKCDAMIFYKKLTE